MIWRGNFLNLIHKFIVLLQLRTFLHNNNNNNNRNAKIENDTCSTQICMPIYCVSFVGPHCTAPHRSRSYTYTQLNFRLTDVYVTCECFSK